jgi:endoglucanase
MIGEIGVGNDSSDWNTEMANGLAAAAQAGIRSFTYWAGGPWWGTYPMSIEPRHGHAAPQMTIVRQYGIDGAGRDTVIPISNR